MRSSSCEPHRRIRRCTRAIRFLSGTRNAPSTQPRCSTQWRTSCSSARGVLAVARRRRIGASSRSAVVAAVGAEYGPLEIHPALEAVEHGPQQARDHRTAVARALPLTELDHERAERRTVRPLQPRHEGRNARSRYAPHCLDPRRVSARFRECFEQTCADRGARSRRSTRRARRDGIVDGDAARARQQHLHELAVGRVAIGHKRVGTVALGNGGSLLCHYGAS